MRVADFDYLLPEEKIAKYPPQERGSTRLLVLDRHSGEVEHSRYADLDAFLQPGDLLVLNDTRVVKARLFARKLTGAHIELMLLEKHDDDQRLVLCRGRVKKMMNLKQTAINCGLPILSIMALPGLRCLMVEY